MGRKPSKRRCIGFDLILPFRRRAISGMNAAVGIPGGMMNASRPASKAGKAGEGNGWLVALVLAILAIVGISKCSEGDHPRTAADVVASDPSINTLKTAVAAQTPPPVRPLSSAGVSAGLADMTAAVGAEGLSGAMIYSQNCYDALSRSFEWRTLDICGAADLKALAAVPEDEAAGPEKEVAYFQSEVAAARYLGAATGAGATPDAADERLAGLQAKLPAPRPDSVAAAEDKEDGHAGQTEAAPDDEGGVSAIDNLDAVM